MPQVNRYMKPPTETVGICISQSPSMNSDETDPGQVNKNPKLEIFPRVFTDGFYQTDAAIYI